MDFMRVIESFGKDLASGINRVLKQDEYNALIYAGAAVITADGVIDSREINSFVDDCNDIPWLDGYKEQIESDLNKAAGEYSRNKANAGLTASEYWKKVSDEKVKRQIYGVVCNVASSDGNIDQEEIRVLEKISSVFSLDTGEAEDIMRMFGGETSVKQMRGEVSGSKSHGAPGWS